jgi:hypothetical protein
MTILQVMERLWDHPEPPILSAFVRPSLRGKLYVEAASEAHVQQGLLHLSNIQLHKIFRVPIDEALALLNLNVRFFTVNPGDFVRPRNGLYCGDLAVVLVVDNTYVRIALIPRLHVSLDGAKNKRKRTRPNKRLFDEKDIIKTRGIDSVTRNNEVFRFKGQTFKAGLLELDIALKDLEQEHAETSADELYEYIRIAGHSHKAVAESIAQALSRVAAASIKVGDRVQVISGEGRGALGFVEEVRDDQVELCISNAKSGGFDTITKPNTSLVKHFVIQDFVKARSGAETGMSGWVVHCSDGIAIVYAESRKEASAQTERMLIFTNQPTHRLPYPLGT